MQNVPVDKADVSSSMMQVGQRLGSAVGLTVALSIYYGATASGARAAEAAHRTLTLTCALFVVALCMAVIDAVQRRRD